MKFWLEIQRRNDIIDRREITPGVLCGEAEGRCPGCGAVPFLVAGVGAEPQGGGVYRAGGRSQCCNEAVGFIFAKEETIFGAEEDRAMGEFARCRVYR